MLNGGIGMFQMWYVGFNIVCALVSVISIFYMSFTKRWFVPQKVDDWIGSNRKFLGLLIVVWLSIGIIGNLHKTCVDRVSGKIDCGVVNVSISQRQSRSMACILSAVQTIVLTLGMTTFSGDNLLRRLGFRGIHVLTALGGLITFVLCMVMGSLVTRGTDSTEDLDIDDLWLTKVRRTDQLLQVVNLGLLMAFLFGFRSFIVEPGMPPAPHIISGTQSSSSSTGSSSSGLVLPSDRAFFIPQPFQKQPSKNVSFLKSSGFNLVR